MKTIKQVLLACMLALAAGMAWLAWYAARPLPIVQFPQQFSVTPGTSLTGLAVLLAKAGIVDHPLAFRILGRVMGKSATIKAGVYTLEAPITPAELYRKMERGEVTQAAIRFIEGWNIRDVRAALLASSDLRHDSQAMSDADLLRAIGARETKPEGLFFPDTYFFSPGSSDLDIMRRAYHEAQEKLRKAWEVRAFGLPYQSPYEALIMASIIEKETAVPEERPLIAAVFLNRLKLGMRLQTDPSVIYGLGERFDGNLRKLDLERDTPYNTYTRKGLPPTPIAMPGQASIQAALNPAQSSALYFVSTGSGFHVFSDNLAEHNQAVNRYQR
ncbi:MAG TPA: endolytic transglycosylase MltG [Thiobacillaceae bacterium]|nr:endolytic transglycosylase MltG [Thiobacillaceae bacterium]